MNTRDKEKTMAKNEKAKPKRKMASKVIRTLCIRHPDKHADKIRAMAEAEIGGPINDITFLGHFLNARYIQNHIKAMGYEIVKAGKAAAPAK